MKDQDKLKIGIGFFGLPRASKVTLPSISKNIIIPAQEIGETIIRYHFYHQKHVHNPSRNENIELTPENYDLFDQFSGALENPEGVIERYGIERIKSYGDAWDNNYGSLRNLILQLHSLQQVTVELLKESPDIVIFARPDLTYHDSMSEEILSALNDGKSIARLPAWQWCGGYNDRFSICNKHAIRPYGLRLFQIDRYLDTYNRPLHSERLLRFALDSATIKVKPIQTRASRVRAGGVIQDEKFNNAVALRRIRWRIREIAKAVTLKI
jgi:hypothetical protein